jgi:hypothetical protein
VFGTAEIKQTPCTSVNHKGYRRGLRLSTRICPADDRQHRQTAGPHVRFEVFTEVIMKNGVFWDVIQEPLGVTSQKTLFFTVPKE